MLTLLTVALPPVYAWSVFVLLFVGTNLPLFSLNMTSPASIAIQMCSITHSHCAQWIYLNLKIFVFTFHFQLVILLSMLLTTQYHSLHFYKRNIFCLKTGWVEALTIIPS